MIQFLYALVCKWRGHRFGKALDGPYKEGFAAGCLYVCNLMRAEYDQRDAK